MKRLLVTTLVIVLLLAGCGPKYKSDISAPDWYLSPPEDPNFLFGAASATSVDFQIALDKAKQDFDKEMELVEKSEMLDESKNRLKLDYSWNMVRIALLKNDIETSNTEYVEREKRLEALTEKLTRIETDHEKLSKAKEAIESSTNDSRAILQKLKVELENQEKEIRDKESRIHRLEVLSAIYRASKFFGGILIGIGIFFIVWAMGVFYNIIDFGNLNNSVMGLFLLIGAVLSIISGIFHLEKS